MVNKKSSRGPASKISSTATPAVNAQSVRSSSILLSAFTPSKLQLSLFASVIQAFDSQHLRVHDIHTGRLKCDHALAAGVKVHSLDWRPHEPNKLGKHGRNSSNNRKRSAPNGVPSDVDGAEAVVAFGTSGSDIQLFSIDDSRIISTLSRGHERGVSDFKFTGNKPSEGWSIGGDGKLVQWDVLGRSVKRTILLHSPDMTALSPPTVQPSPVLCASQIPLAVDLNAEKSKQIIQFDAFRHPVHSLIRSLSSDGHKNELFLAADLGRHSNIYNLEQKKLVRTLIAGSEITSLDFYSDSAESHDSANQILLATTANGTVELFVRPFDGLHSDKSTSNDVKSKRKSLARKCDASIRLIRPDAKGSGLAAIRSSFQGSDVVVAWVEGGVDVTFERVQWQHEETGELSYRGLKEIVRSKKASTLNSVNVNGVKDPGKAYVDESQTVVLDVPTQTNLGTQQDDAILISSGDVADDTDDDSEQEIEEQEIGETQTLQSTAGVSRKDKTEALEHSDREVEDVDANAEYNGTDTRDTGVDEEDQEPTFGDLVEAREAAEPISIVDAVADLASTELAPSVRAENSSLQRLPSGHSLSTILTQSLRTNDQSLLESCFHETDNSTIRLTVQRMDSSLASILLERIAERLSRPGRYAQLLVWLQWVCVAHGGVIASRPDVLQKIRLLNAALTKRSHALNSLLLLKGKLDMLDAQVGLRRAMATQRAGISGRQGKAEDVIYIEGQEESSSSDDDEMTGTRPKRKGRIGTTLEDLTEENEGIADDVADDVEDAPMANGVTSASEDEEEDEDDGGGDSEEEEEEYEEDDDERNGEPLVDDEAVLDLDEGSDAAEVSEDESEGDNDASDAEMDDFINDGEISVADSDDERALEDTPDNPPAKRHKKR
ncbi:MAG: hypothetical protein Q9160_004815 [Pyrenula sp. 1 TL-2023]